MLRRQNSPRRTSISAVFRVTMPEPSPARPGVPADDLPSDGAPAQDSAPAGGSPPDQGLQSGPVDAPAEPSPAPEPASEPVDLGRISWAIVVLALLVGMVVLLAKGDYGYAIVTFAVGVSAAINLL